MNMSNSNMQHLNERGEHRDRDRIQRHQQMTSPSVRWEHLLDCRDLRNINIVQPNFGGPLHDNHMPQPLAVPPYPQLQPPFQMQQGNQLLATHSVDYNKRLLDGFQNQHAERGNQRCNRLRRQEQAEDQMIQHQEAIQLQRQEQQLAEDHQEREIECQESYKLSNSLEFKELLKKSLKGGKMS
ncbi:hypothetical protein SERLA73DRAFT_156027 [Serpula lacrymans var. lacrymans S7.3]|uniref:Uncharacterized protein n=1 Tax=Serpula lacrymans var. lacrymans (strain S7.3) TaxID=936435 RepID=F8QCL7_SERL3|nr:hypothetical protein SERLA73DRAFT_156027 [Serpula lacrymans var. lacrymans S7.3]